MAFYMDFRSGLAAGITRDLLQGTQIQRVPGGGALVSLAAVSKGAAAADTQVLDVFIGERQVVEKARPGALTSAGNSANSGPKIPADLILDDEPAAGGELIVINVNSSAANGQLHYRLNVEPL